ncbi:BMC domain-containing protein [bacterium]|nr:BMC domain-containing protein [bacterium]
MEKALGMIETRGVVGLIEAADAAVKAAKISLVDYEKSTGGLTIIKFRGSVGAVQAAVEAGAAAADKIGELVSAHVIPNPHQNTELEITPPQELKTFSTKPVTLESLKAKIKTDAVVKTKPKPKAASKAKISDSEKETNLWKKVEKNGIDSLKAFELRFLARRIKEFPLEKNEIRVAGKKKLLQAFKKVKI